MSTISDDEHIVFSDEEPEVAPAVQWDEVKAWTIPFGRYKGTELSVLIRDRRGRDYLKWLLKWEALRMETKVKFDCALEHYKSKKLQRDIPDLPRLELKRQNAIMGSVSLMSSDDDDKENCSPDVKKKRKRRRNRASSSS